MLMYRIRNKETGSYFHGGHNKVAWLRVSDAKNAWNAKYSGYRRGAYQPKFSEQSEWECVEVELVPTGVIA